MDSPGQGHEGAVRQVLVKVVSAHAPQRLLHGTTSAQADHSLQHSPELTVVVDRELVVDSKDTEAVEVVGTVDVVDVVEVVEVVEVVVVVGVVEVVDVVGVVDVLKYLFTLVSHKKSTLWC